MSRPADRWALGFLVATLGACGAPAQGAQRDRVHAPTAPPAIVHCPDEESWLAGRPPLEQAVRQSLHMPCVAGPGGRWELALTGLERGALSEEEHGGTGDRFTGHFAPAFVDASGRSQLGPSRPLEISRAQDWWSTDTLEVRGHFDLDGDGLEELLVWIGRADYEGTPRGEVVVLTARGGVVTPYGPASVGVPIDDVEDVDGDGRPDLVSRTPYGGMSPWGASPVPAGGPPNVFRSLPDGTFSGQDPVILGRLREACPARPEHFLPAQPSEDGYEVSITAVSCARIHGVPTEEIVSAIQAEHARGVCTNAHWADCAQLVEELTRHAAITPAHRLP